MLFCQQRASLHAGPTAGGAATGRDERGREGRLDRHRRAARAGRRLLRGAQAPVGPAAEGPEGAHAPQMCSCITACALSVRPLPMRARRQDATAAQAAAVAHRCDAGQLHKIHIPSSFISRAIIAL